MDKITVTEARERLVEYGAMNATIADLHKVITGRGDVTKMTRLQKLKLKAAEELGRRNIYDKPVNKLEVHQPEDLREPLLSRLGGLTIEKFMVVLMTARNRVISINQVSSGTVDCCVLHPREVFRMAIEAEAAGIIIAHNHPSGNPQPSAEDIALTERFRKVASALGVKLLDHVVIAGTELVSIRAMGHWGDVNGTNAAVHEHNTKGQQ